MITIVYPYELNWFYTALAQALERGLRREGYAARAVTAQDLVGSVPASAGTVLIVSPAECAASLPRGSAVALASRLRGFARRVFVNYDSIHTGWFARHLALGAGLYTDLFDIGAAPQAEGAHAGLPYRWIREARWLRFGEEDEAWTPGRPLPWAVIGHADASRAALVSGLVRLGRPGGIVYLPPLRPYGAGAGLDAAGMHAVLRRCDLYVWNSHHQYPYHEGVRAIQAVAAGAAPAKIDPFHAERFADLPWVYPSLRALFAALEVSGPEGLHRQARAFIDRVPALELGILAALGLPGGGDDPAGDRARDDGSGVCSGSARSGEGGSAHDPRPDRPTPGGWAGLKAGAAGAPA